jgi:hypothetical protein
MKFYKITYYLKCLLESAKMESLQEIDNSNGILLGRMIIFFFDKVEPIFPIEICEPKKSKVYTSSFSYQMYFFLIYSLVSYKKNMKLWPININEYCKFLLTSSQNKFASGTQETYSFQALVITRHTRRRTRGRRRWT